MTMDAAPLCLFVENEQGFSYWVYYHFPSGINLLKVNNRSTRIRCEIVFKVINKDTKTIPMALF